MQSRENLQPTKKVYQYGVNGQFAVIAYLRILSSILVIKQQHSDVEIIRPLLNVWQPLPLNEWIEKQCVSQTVQHVQVRYHNAGNYILLDRINFSYRY